MNWLLFIRLRNVLNWLHLVAAGPCQSGACTLLEELSEIGIFTLSLWHDVARTYLTCPGPHSFGELCVLKVLLLLGLALIRIWHGNSGDPTFSIGLCQLGFLSVYANLLLAWKHSAGFRDDVTGLGFSSTGSCLNWFLNVFEKPLMLGAMCSCLWPISTRFDIVRSGFCRRRILLAHAKPHSYRIDSLSLWLVVDWLGHVSD